MKMPPAHVEHGESLMTPDHDSEIAKHAYTIWESEGRPSGRDLDHWLRAEAEVKAEHGTNGATAPTRVERVQTAPTAAPVKPQRPAARRVRRTQ